MLSTLGREREGEVGKEVWRDKGRDGRKRKGGRKGEKGRGER